MHELQSPGATDQMKAFIDEVLRRGRLAAAWLASQVDDNGALPCDGDLGSYYKCIYPLRLAGYPAQASTMLRHVMRLHYKEDGDLRNSDQRRTTGTYTSYFCQVYPNGWIIQGAFLLGRFDIVRMLMRGVINNFYDEEMGTFRSSYLPCTEQFDVNSAAMAVELFLLMDIKKAKRAGDFLIRLIENQPDPDNWFYARVEKPFNYITVPDPRSATYSAIKIGEEKQGYWFLGLSCAALAQLYDYTGEKKYLNAAVRYFDTFLSCGEPIYHWIASGKSFWAGAMLYRITGDKKYLACIRKIAEFFFSIQRDDGLVLMPGMTAEEMGAKLKFDIGPEDIRWFFDVAAELSISKQ